jgi:hypothetical protein
VTADKVAAGNMTKIYKGRGGRDKGGGLAVGGTVGGVEGMKTNNEWTLPLARAVDVVVVGGGLAAVAAALELRARGRSVLVVAERAYLGEDVAGVLALRPDAAGAGEDALARALEAERGAGGLLFPGAVKRVLEGELLRAGARFLFAARPVVLLRAGGAPAGLVIAHRSSLFAVRCGGVVDASATGLVARLAGVPLVAARGAAEGVAWRVGATATPAAAGGAGPEAEFTVAGEKEPVAVGLWRLELERPAGDRRERTHRMRAALADPALTQFADAADEAGEEVVARGGRLAETPGALADEDFLAEPGLWLAGGVLPLDRLGAERARTMREACAIGRRAARLAAEAPRGAGVAGEVTAQAGVAAGAGGGGLGFVPAFLRETDGVLRVAAPGFEELGAWDVVVAGGGTGGGPAGVAAAREGVRTLVLETQAQLGGVGTTGLISRYWFGRREGFTRELDTRIAELDTERANQSGWNPELKACVHHRLLAEAGGAAWTESFVCAARVEGGRVAAVLVSTPWGCGLVRAGCVVDATGSADVAAAAGAECRVTGREHAAVQGTGLSPRSPGRDYCNSDHTFVDDQDPEGVTHAHARARAKFAREFDVAPFVDSRERRQIVGELEISPADLLAGRDYADTVCAARSNFDSHGFTVHPVFMLVAPDKRPLEAKVPLRALLPRGLEGVLVTGLGMSAHRDALPVIRMQADVQNQGFAAGLVAARASRGGVGVREVELGAVRAVLARMGALEAEGRGAGGDELEVSDARLREATALRGLEDAAWLFAFPERARGVLRERVAEAGGGGDAALALGLLGDAAAAPELLRRVSAGGWDEGWNFRGMHQFGASLSRLDVAVIALGRTRVPEAVDVVAEKIRALGADAAFSHARAVGVAAACLRSAELAEPLRELLGRPGVRGHAELSTGAACAGAVEDRNENGARNLALRELYLARGLLACGDAGGVAREILETYARDLRGVFARHARELLEKGVPEDVAEVA